MRKPDPPIYELTVARLSGVDAEQCLFIDDLAVNIETARAMGMYAVHFRDNEQTIGEVRGLLGLSR